MINPLTDVHNKYEIPITACGDFPDAFYNTFFTGLFSHNNDAIQSMSHQTAAVYM